VVRLQFDDFVVGQVYLKESTKTITRDSVVVGKVEVEGVKRDVYGKSPPSSPTFHKKVSSRGLLDMQILDPIANRVVNQQKMPGEFVWQSEWGTFQGRRKGAEQKATGNLQAARSAAPAAPGPLHRILQAHLRPGYRQPATVLPRITRLETLDGRRCRCHPKKAGPLDGPAFGFLSLV
jgi:hypothetical protein